MALTIMVALGFFGAAIYFYGQWSFQRKLSAAKEKVANQTDSPNSQEPTHITEQDLASLPNPVKKWLQNSGVLGKKKVKITRLKQTGWIRLKPDQKEWTRSESEQIINVAKPSFVWNVKMSVSGLPVLGMDQFYQGQGSMFITILGLFPIVNVSHENKINQSALQRFLGEIIWTPTAAISPWIEWTANGENSARAKMTVNGVSGDATFYFSESGDLVRFVAMRFKDVTDEKPLEWHADVKASQSFHGVRVPSSIEATWLLPDGPFTWFKFEVTDVGYEEN